MTPRESAQQEAEVTYKLFLKFCKYVSYLIIAGLLVVASCNFGVDGTGGGYDPDNAKEYQQRMIEMGEKFKNKH
tara:strand:- start:935 stop:1156 length:222 start_codon:yes stop_codon:yes gene_type:complete